MVWEKIAISEKNIDQINRKIVIFVLSIVNRLKLSQYFFVLPQAADFQ